MASIPLIIIAYTKCNLTVMIICYVLSTISRSILSAGIEPVLIDLSPKFCGMLNYAFHLEHHHVEVKEN